MPQKCQKYTISVQKTNVSQILETKTLKGDPFCSHVKITMFQLFCDVPKNIGWIVWFYGCFEL